MKPYRRGGEGSNYYSTWWWAARIRRRIHYFIYTKCSLGAAAGGINRHWMRTEQMKFVLCPIVCIYNGRSEKNAQRTEAIRTMRAASRILFCVRKDGNHAQLLAGSIPSMHREFYWPVSQAAPITLTCHQYQAFESSSIDEQSVNLI